MDGFEELTIELTDWCPSSCLHCSSYSSSACSNHLETKLVLQLIDEAVRLGAKKISLGGGEPIASKSFVPAVIRSTALGAAVEVFTCGLSKYKGQLHGLRSKTINDCKGLCGLKFIFSFHGASESVHDYVAQTPNSFKLLTASLEKCLIAGIECEMNFVPMRVNVHEFRELVNLAERFGIQQLSILRFVPQGRGLENAKILELNKEEEDLFVEELLHLRAESNIDIRTGSPFNGIIPGNKIPCRAGFGKLVVQPNGNVLPCEVFKHQNRREWQLSIYDMKLCEILESPQIKVLHDFVDCGNRLKCPVHNVLRIAKEWEESHALSKSAIQAK